MPKDPEQFAHQEWLGYVQPIGLVVSIPAMLHAQAHVQRNIAEEHSRFLSCLPRDKQDEVIPEIRDFPAFTRTVLSWEANDLIGAPGGEPLPASLEATLPGYNETLRPTYAVREFQPQEASRPWMLLIKSLAVGTDLDALSTDSHSHWQASPHSKFERLLRETQVPFGLLVNGTHLRLVYAPRGETSGYATFSVADMAKVAGRPIFAALHMLLCAERLFSLPEKQRLPAILADSRKYQNVVSTQLAEQVLAALYELVRGFQAADEQRRGELLRDVLGENPNHVYAGLLTVLLRLVFVLFAEDRGLLSSDPVYSNFYSVTGLFERLRADAGRYTDTMDQRYGAWAQLLTLFRLIYDGGQHGGLKIPARRGYLFDPDRYNFLEGRQWKAARRHAEKVDVPHIADGVIYRVLEKLLVLDGERLSYRTLDVEQIGSVYETMMGFNLEVAQGRSIAIKPTKPHGAPTSINLDELIATKPADRVKWIAEKSDQKLTGPAAESLKSAASVEDLLAALDRKIARHATPNVVPKAAMLLQPSDERRRSGSHYTPRSLTEPIVRTTLKPILEQLGPHPRPEQILALKICDPAMGSGAFLVEVCRQLAEALVEAWHFHNCLPKLPPDEDEVLHARRLIAQHCLYGVDKNPMAVDLSKLSLWLATLAKDHPFTFLDHSLRCGDSLVGLSREQIAAFHWQPKDQKHLLEQELTTQIARATEARRKILTAPESTPYADKQQALAVADEALDRVRRLGNLVIAAFFSVDKPKQRDAKLGDYLSLVTRARGKDGRAEDITEWIRILNSLHGGDHPLQPFHWQIEFPEVFTVDAKEKPNGGFDAMVGNPPFAGKNTLINGNRDGYLDWLKTLHEESHGNADLVSHFFRRAFNLLRAPNTSPPRQQVHSSTTTSPLATGIDKRAADSLAGASDLYGGCFGLIATNTIGQGDTRSTGLRWICTHGGTIYAARKRLKWPGQAAVVVSVVNVCRGAMPGPFVLDGREVPIITAYLFHAGGHENPASLQVNSGRALKGPEIGSLGFLLTPNDPDFDEIATLADPRNSTDKLLKPYLGGEDLNANATMVAPRFIMDTDGLSDEQLLRFPKVRQLIHQRVRADFIARGELDENDETWWNCRRPCDELRGCWQQLRRVLCVARVSQTCAFTYIPIHVVANEKIVVFRFDDYSTFTLLQSRLHEGWARFFSATMKDDLQYALTDCFENFPFPAGVQEHAAGDSPTTDNGPLTTLETAGREYYEFRAALMVRHNEGLTKTYNRFHDPHETSPDILQLRALHAAMDRAVLEAYAWHDLAQTATCEFLLDYEDDEDEDEGSGGRSPGSGRQKKKPWRYRWPDPFRDEVLARLLELNKQRAEQERLTGLAAAAAATKTPKAGKKRGTKKSSDDLESPGLF